VKPVPLRWLVFGVFVLSSALNYLDRQVLAALAPLLKAEFHLSNAEYGLILSAFSIAYALCAPVAGLLIDRIGLNVGISVSVALWSLSGIATGFASGLGAFMSCRAALGVAESAGVPATGKAISLYLKPEERAVGNGLSQTGISIGSMLAPPLSIWLAVNYGWRAAFVATGLAGLLWIPLWSMVSSKAPVQKEALPRHHHSASVILRDPRLWGFIIANVLSMTVYTLWFNWTTLFLVQVHGLTLVRTAWLAWAPPFFASIGGLLGGWVSLRFMRRGMAALDARMRVCLFSAVLLLVTAAVPWMPSAWWATAAICISFFGVTAMSVNVYTMPLDVFGVAHAAFAVSLLTSAYGVMQTLISPVIGGMIDHYGFGPVCVVIAMLPFVGYLALRATNGK
jgi:MFS transporter, ACS family, hexuronate transporter